MVALEELLDVVKAEEKVLVWNWEEDIVKEELGCEKLVGLVASVR